MKRFLLFAGAEVTKANGLMGFVADFDSCADALLSLVDQQSPSDWWHVLDTHTGEVIERHHIHVRSGLIGFQRSDRVVGSQAQGSQMPAPAPPDTVMGWRPTCEPAWRALPGAGAST